ncbi:MAG: DUF3471 domain-containing protein [Flammeovirgaceae bacterium]|nr:DUF3471 domain-containing protein [Flammeovirgaceae bacterium]
MESNLSAALAIFKLNTSEYPSSSNVYDSYGEALAKNGQKELAIENYKKSVEMNPGNQGGIDALEKLGVKMDTKDADVSENVLESYVGTYELAPGFNLEVTRTGKQLFTQATGQAKFEIYAKSETEFYLKVVDAQITFELAENRLVLHQNGRDVPGKKVK